MDLNHKQLGSGPPLVILHGLFGMLDNWFTIAKNLSDQYTVYLIDQRNHGKSPRSNVMNYRLMANDLLEFLNTKNIDKPHLLGHSMGGKTIMRFALNYPERVNKLIVADISPAQYENKHKMLIDAMLAVDFNKHNTRQDVENALRRKIRSNRLIQFLLKNLYWKSKNMLDWKSNLDAIIKNLPDIGNAIESDIPYFGSTLFIKAGRSEYISVKEKHIIKKLFPLAEIKTISGATHWLHDDKPEEFTKLVSEYLALS